LRHQSEVDERQSQAESLAPLMVRYKESPAAAELVISTVLLSPGASGPDWSVFGPWSIDQMIPSWARYVRQLWDAKGSALVELMEPNVLAT